MSHNRHVTYAGRSYGHGRHDSTRRIFTELLVTAQIVNPAATQATAIKMAKEEKERKRMKKVETHYRQEQQGKVQPKQSKSVRRNYK